jgi:hypothetical protein
MASLRSIGNYNVRRGALASANRDFATNRG